MLLIRLFLDDIRENLVKAKDHSYD